MSVPDDPQANEDGQSTPERPYHSYHTISTQSFLIPFHNSSPCVRGMRNYSENVVTVYTTSRKPYNLIVADWLPTTTHRYPCGPFLVTHAPLRNHPPPKTPPMPRWDRDPSNDAEFSTAGRNSPAEGELCDGEDSWFMISAGDMS